MASWSDQLLAELIDTHARALVLYARAWSFQPDDVVQEAFVALLRLQQPPDRPAAWLFGTVRKLALMSARSERRRQRHEAQSAAQLGWFDEAEITELDHGDVTKTLAGLPEEEREVVIAHLWGKLTFEEIGKLQECSAPTAYRRYATGLGRLRERLGVTWTAKS